jgi:hypothetical protein
MIRYMVDSAYRPGFDIDWVLEAEVTVTKLTSPQYVHPFYFVEEAGSPHRHCVISFATGRMLFDGHDIETEAFMCYVGLLDQVGEYPMGQPVSFAGESW